MLVQGLGWGKPLADLSTKLRPNSIPLCRAPNKARHGRRQLGLPLQRSYQYPKSPQYPNNKLRMNAFTNFISSQIHPAPPYCYPPKHKKKYKHMNSDSFQLPHTAVPTRWPARGGTTQAALSRIPARSSSQTTSNNTFKREKSTSTNAFKQEKYRKNLKTKENQQTDPNVLSRSSSRWTSVPTLPTTNPLRASR